MTDFFDRVERELSRAIEREQGDGARRRKGRVAAWFASHSALALAGGAIAVGGAGAAAAVATIHGTPSAPTAGLVPRGPQEHRRRDLHYKLTVSPSLQVGQVGWCENFDLRYSKAAHYFGGAGCTYAPLRGGRPIIIGSTTYLGNGRGLIASMVVDRSVAVAELTSGTKIVPASDPALPNGWRAIVLLPGESHDGKIHVRDAQGRPFPNAYRSDPHAFAPVQPVRASASVVPGGAPCTIDLPAAMSPRGSHWLPELEGLDGLPGYAFAACAQTSLRVNDQWAEVTVLLDAAKPGGAQPAPLSGATPSAGDPAIVELPATGSYYVRPPGSPKLGQFSIPAGEIGTAKRVGNAWVVVRAKSRATRELVLRAATVHAPGG